jgi:4-hydroxybenzoate polyprenyltransferase/phosphoserine phosphatase
MTKEASLNPLYVDLDGTFIKSDMLYESLLVALKNNPFVILMSLIWLLKGRAFLKSKLSERVDLNIALLPLNPNLYQFLCEQKKKGRRIILATASHEKHAESICAHYDLFDGHVSSTKEINLKGQAKLDRILAESPHFAYAGNSSEDFILFNVSQESYLVNPTSKAMRLAQQTAVTATFDQSSSSLKVWAKQLRIHQWLKNLLILVPLLVSGAFTHIDALILTLIGFVSFSFLASATYIVNDLLDLDSDRNHLRKRFRPLAAGNLSIFSGMLCSLTLFILALVLACFVAGYFIWVLLAYLILTLLYSFKIKQYIGLDVMVLASLYTIRIMAGAAIIAVPVSFWLLSFSMFIFLSLALIKRCAELKAFVKQNKTQASGRDYNTLDYDVLMNIGTSSAMLSVLMFCFYINSNVLSDQYQSPTLLWLVLPALCYWLMRMWIKTHRGEMHDDPIVYSLRDKGSLVTIGFMGVVALLAQIL